MAPPRPGPRADTRRPGRGVTAHWLVRFGYDGAGFVGWAHQPGARTVEGELVRALHQHRQFRSHAPAAIPVASRTDRGVSARGNALRIESPLDGDALLRALNGLAPDIFFTHAREVGPAFLPRRATGRTYRYLEPAAGHDVGRWQALADGFLGTFDVRSFGRGLPGDRPTRRTLERFSVTADGEWLVIELAGPGFVWGMVRKLIAALRAAEAGSLTESQLAAARRGTRRLPLPLAEPEGLILWEVHYATPWEFDSPGWNRHQQRYWERVRLTAARRRAVAERLAGSSVPTRYPGQDNVVTGPARGN